MSEVAGHVTHPLTLDDFSAFFGEVWGSEGKPAPDPFPWQLELLAQVHQDRRWPDLVDLPTGSGKTSMLDLAVFLLAMDAGSPPSERWMARRIILVVDRRVIVDQAAQRGARITDALREPLGPISARVAARLRSLSDGGPPLVAGVLRGGIERDRHWAARPDVPALISSTVDQVGSRLLFRGYGVSRGMWPVHAGLLGADCLVLLDEVHLARPFADTLAQISGYRAWVEDHQALPDRWQVVELSATPSTPAARRFPGHPLEPGPHPVLARRLTARKPAVLAPITVPRNPTKASERFALGCARLAGELIERRGLTTVGVIVNRVDTARRVARQLLAMIDGDVVLLTGRMRPLDRDEVLGTYLPRLQTGRERRDDDRPVVVVATQSIEAGADFDLDGIVTECASLDALRQRFGRVDRDGQMSARDTPSYSVIAIRSTDVGATEPDPIYGGALAATWAWLSGLAVVDFGITAFVDPDLNRMTAMLPPARQAPVLLPSHLDLLVQTSQEGSVDPVVDRWLHGLDRDAEIADVQLVWRSDLDISIFDPGGPDRAPKLWLELESGVSDRLSACPPLSGEMLGVSIGAFRRWASSVADGDGLADVTLNIDEDAGPNGTPTTRRYLRWRNGEATLVDARVVRPGDTVVLPLAAGGIWERNWDPDETSYGQWGFATDVSQKAAYRQRGRAVHRLLPLPLVDAIGGGSRAARSESEDDSRHDGVEQDVDDSPMVVPRPDELESERTADRRKIVRDFLADQAQVDVDEERGEILRHLASDPSLRLLPLPHGTTGTEILRSYVVSSTRPVRQASQKPDLGEEDGRDAVSFTGTTGVELHDHLLGVEGWARRFATGLGLPSELIGAVALAGRLHDLGKADARFQLWLHDADEVAAARSAPLAKSTTPDVDHARRKRARARSGYPAGARHELASVAMLTDPTALAAEAYDADLVLHLVASHHGYGRYRFDPVADDQPIEVSFELDGTPLSTSSDHGLDRLDAGTPERFWTLIQRYGWYGLAWLEAILRLADHERSRQEQLRLTQDGGAP